MISAVKTLILFSLACSQMAQATAPAVLPYIYSQGRVSMPSGQSSIYVPNYSYNQAPAIAQYRGFGQGSSYMGSKFGSAYARPAQNYSSPFGYASSSRPMMFGPQGYYGGQFPQPYSGFGGGNLIGALLQSLLGGLGGGGGSGINGGNIFGGFNNSSNFYAPARYAYNAYPTSNSTQFHTAYSADNFSPSPAVVAQAERNFRPQSYARPNATVQYASARNEPAFNPPVSQLNSTNNTVVAAPATVAMPASNDASSDISQFDLADPSLEQRVSQPNAVAAPQPATTTTTSIPLPRARPATSTATSSTDTVPVPRPRPATAQFASSDEADVPQRNDRIAGSEDTVRSSVAPSPRVTAVTSKPAILNRSELRKIKIMQALERNVQNTAIWAPFMKRFNECTNANSPYVNLRGCEPAYFEVHAGNNRMSCHQGGRNARAIDLEIIKCPDGYHKAIDSKVDQGPFADLVQCMAGSRVYRGKFLHKRTKNDGFGALWHDAVPGSRKWHDAVHSHRTHIHFSIGCYGGMW